MCSVKTPADARLSSCCPCALQGARRLLEETGLALKTVAQRCGLGSPAAMRRVFMREPRRAAGGVSREILFTVGRGGSLVLTEGRCRQSNSRLWHARSPAASP